MKRFTNAVFYTMKNENDYILEVITDQGIIKHTGLNLSHIPVDEVIDLNGAYVYPGFIDSHLHLLGYGQKLLIPSLLGIKDKKTALSLIEKHITNEPLIFYDYRFLGITHQDLDAISTTVPIILRHQDYHSVTVNSFVIETFKVDHEMGTVFENEAQTITNHYMTYDQDRLDLMLKTSIESLWSFGVTGGHSDDLFYYGNYKKTLNTFLKASQYMPFRTQLLIHHEVLDAYLNDQLPQHINPYLSMGPIKMFYDGTIGSKTAYIKKPYKNSISHGAKSISPNDFDHIMKKIRAHDLTAAVHVIGDQATIDVCHLFKKYPVKQGLSDRLIHTPWLDQEALDLMASLNLFIDVQPQFLSADLPWAFDVFTEIPPFVFPWKTMLDHQLKIAFSSDAPVEIPNPLLGIFDSVQRQSSHDLLSYSLEQSVSRFEAIKAYTVTPNQFTYHNNRGFIEPGYIADFSAFKKDLLKVDINQLKSDLVAYTIIDEKIVYKASKKI